MMSKNSLISYPATHQYNRMTDEKNGIIGNESDRRVRSLASLETDVGENFASRFSAQLHSLPYGAYQGLPSPHCLSHHLRAA